MTVAFHLNPRPIPFLKVCVLSQRQRQSSKIRYRPFHYRLHRPTRLLLLFYALFENWRMSNGENFFANQGKFSQAGCRPARKFNAKWRKKIHRLGVLTFFKGEIVNTSAPPLCFGVSLDRLTGNYRYLTYTLESSPCTSFIIPKNSYPYFSYSPL